METQQKFSVENFKRAYQELYNLHPQPSEEAFKFRYLRVDWFFSNHIHNVLEQIRLVGSKYFKGVDIEVCLYAGLFHDAGLVYKRETASPKGHENRSVEYAQQALDSLGYKQDFIEKVSECIRATEPTHNATLPEALLVRNADAYAHVISMHFFAKANFSKDIASFIQWFEEKLEITHMKITIPELREEVFSLISHYRTMIQNYKLRMLETDFLDSLFAE